MTKLAAILFDVDGTLAETEEAHRATFNETFHRFGLSWDWDQALYKRLLKVGGGKERMAHYVADHRGGIGPTAAGIAEIHKAKTAAYQERITSGALGLRPGIGELILECRAAGMRMGVVTTTSRGNVITLLENNLGPDSPAWFEVIAAGEDAKAKKPDPALYLFALDRLGLAGGACLAIEDSANGLRSALGAGVPTLITRTFWTAEDDFSGALAVVDDLGGTTLDDLRRLHAGAEPGR